MSRFYDFEESDCDMPAIFWHIDLKRALTSGRGQRILRDIEAGLLAMPEHRLVEGSIVEAVDWNDEEDRPEPSGVCAVGAYAAWLKVKQGQSWYGAFVDLAEDWGGERDCYDTEQLGRSVGLARTVAWQLAYLNDERLAGWTPEQRWHAVLEWVRDQIKPSEEAVPA